MTFAILMPAIPSERLAICASCEHFDATLHRCKLCGCFMQVKARIPQSKCPDRRW
jgi:hypothetical protein